MKLGDRYVVLRDSCGFKEGKEVVLCTICEDGYHCYAGPNTRYLNAPGGKPGAYLSEYNVMLLEDDFEGNV